MLIQPVPKHFVNAAIYVCEKISQENMIPHKRLRQFQPFNYEESNFAFCLTNLFHKNQTITRMASMMRAHFMTMCSIIFFQKRCKTNDGSKKEGAYLRFLKNFFPSISVMYS
jgi:hypothetical protein